MNKIIYTNFTRTALLLMILLAACSSLPMVQTPNSFLPTHLPTIKPTAAGTEEILVATVTQIPMLLTSTPAVTTQLPDSLKGFPLPPADEASARLSIPSGFAIRIFANNLNGSPRFMAFGPDNALYLSLTRAGQIMRLPDANHDGLADQAQVVASRLNQPHGLAWHDGWLYVAENDRIDRMRSSKNDGMLDTIELVTENIPGGSGHFTRTVHFGPDGKMYVSAGSSCNLCVESDPRRAAILRFNTDGSIPSDNPFANDPDSRRRPLWAWGLRNSVDFVWTPSGQLWANMNGRDNLKDAQGIPDNLPPEVIVAPIQPNYAYGWPFCYNGSLGFNSTGKLQQTDPQSGLTLPTGFDCSQAVPALFTDLAHSAPLGMAFAIGANFPAEFQTDLFVAYHGSWNVVNPANIRDCKIERIIVQNGLPIRSEAFIFGWRSPGKSCGDPSTWGRPAGVVFGPAGDLYISDDAGGRVYRVIPTH